MKNNKDTKVSIKLLIIVSFIMLFMGSFIAINKTQSTIQLANSNEKENVTVKIADEKSKTTSRALTSSRKTDIVKEEINNNEIQSEEKVKETATSIVDSNTKYKPINQVKISKTMDLTVRTGLSREDFIKLIAGVRADTSGFFKTNAGTIYDLCEKYQINEIFFCGLISAESGWNIASNHRKTHNYISLMSGGKLLNFSSVQAGLEAAAKTLHNNYLTPGGKLYHGKTLAGVKTRFCPASSTWVNLVYGRMSQII